MNRMSGPPRTTSGGPLRYARGEPGERFLSTSSGEITPDTPDTVDVDKLFHKLNWRLLPLFWFMVVFNYIDRTNLAFAAIQLNRDLGFTPQVYGLGSGLFFTTYATLQIPSNIILRRVGGPSWLAGIIAAWGVVAVSFALMRTQAEFFALRTLLGVAEAGCFPGMWFMLNRFYPPGRITLAFAVVESGVTLSHTLAGPLAAALLTLDGTYGMRGWQWLFLLEGIPSLVLAFVILYLLPASPETASVLTTEERDYLSTKMSAGRNSVFIGGVEHEEGSDPSRRRGQGRDEETAEVLKASEAARLMSSNASNGSSNGSSTGHHHTKALETQRLLDSSAASGSGSGGGGGSGGRVGFWAGLFPADIRLALSAAASNKYVWYLGSVKILKDVAGFGIIFFTPMIVQGLVTGHALDIQTDPVARAASHGKKAPPNRSPSKSQFGGKSSSSRGLAEVAVQQLLSMSAASWQHPGGFSDPGQPLLDGFYTDQQPAWSQLEDQGLGAGGRQLLGGMVGDGQAPPTGVKAALLTSVPFGLAAIATLYLAHRSQAAGERILHCGIPALVCGAIFAFLPLMVTHSVAVGFVCLIAGVVGVNCIAAPSLALLSELAAGPGLVVALPLYNSVGNIGGFVGPFIIGMMITQTHSFAWPCVLMGMCLAVSGCMVLLLPSVLGLPPGTTGTRYRSPRAT